MSTQANEVTLSFVESFESYVTDSKAIGELKSRLEDSRKILEPVIRVHKIPIGNKAENNKIWKEKRAIFFPLVEELEWPRDEEGNKIEKDDISEIELKRMDARIVAWLGVIRTCLELQILPTDKNADRLRKARVWMGLNGNGKVNPNWVDPNKKTEVKDAEGEEAEKQVDALMEKIEQTIKREDDKKMKGIGDALALATMERGTSTSPATPQKAKSGVTPKVETVLPLHANVNSSEAPISSREHFGVLFDQLTKNETFRTEYVDILCAMLEVEKATLTRCLVQARDAIK